MKQFTSASANKYIRQLQDEKSHILQDERKVCTYVLAVGETEEPPEYDYDAVRDQVDNIDTQVLKIRHALHCFNANTILPEAGITIDEALVLMAQLSSKKSKLSSMRERRQKERNGSSRFYSDSGTVEYTYANYDIAKAASDYLATCEKINELQLELDLINQTRVFEVDL